jgi:hypothetical protein
MDSKSLIVSLLLVFGALNSFADDHIDFSDPNLWIATQIEFKGMQQQQAFVAGMEKFARSRLGQKFPGTMALNWLMINGKNSATHGFIMAFPNQEARSKWNMAFWSGDSPEASKWMTIWSATVENSEERAFKRVASWGSVTSSNATIETIPFQTSNLLDFTKKFAKWMETKTAKKFKGMVSIHQCVYCGESEFNSLMTVSHNSAADLDEWGSIFATSEDADDWLSSSQEIALFAGNSLVYRLQSYPVNSSELLEK